jgi:transposase
MTKGPLGRPAKHSVEFMMAVAEQVLSGQMSYRQASERYGVSHGSISCWKEKYRKFMLHRMKQAGRKGALTPVGREAALELENKQLKQELADLYLQVRMLKKVQAFEEQAKRDASSIITSESFERSKRGAK